MHFESIYMHLSHENIHSVIHWAYSLTYIAYYFLLPYIHITYPDIYVYYILIGLFLHFCDFAISDSPNKTIRVMNKNGYSTPLLMVNMIFNILVIHSVWIILGNFILNSVDIQYEFNLALCLKLVSTLIIVDIYFYFGHKRLHETKLGAKIHFMHHVSFYISISTGLIFNTFDFCLEFGMPLVILFTFGLIYNDAAFVIICGCIILGWYAAEHDENIKLHHYEHHTDCNGDYPVYAKWRNYNAKDRIKPMIVDIHH